MRDVWGLLATSLLAATAAAAGSLTVVQPSSLASDIAIEASMGNFGHLSYGSTIMGRVVVPQGDDARYGCKPF